MAGITIDDIERSERVRAVTDNFFFWQGRRFIALGPVLIVAGFIANAHLDQRLPTACSSPRSCSRLIVSALRRPPLPRGVRQRPPDSGRPRAPFADQMAAGLSGDVRLAHARQPLSRPRCRSSCRASSGRWGWCSIASRPAEGRVHYLALAACLAGLGLAPLATAMTSRDMVPVMMLVLGAGYTAAVLLDDDEMRAVLRGG